jgi:hypothetical protein
VSVKVLSPLVPPLMTSAQRDAIPAGRRPKGALIFNSTTNRHETNLGTDAAPIWLPAAGPIDMQVITGDDSGYSAAYTGAGPLQLYANAAGTTPLRISYTPPVNCWWECTINLGLLMKTDANYNYFYGGLTLTPNDADGRSSGYNLVMQHNSVQTYEGRFFTSLFKLVAGTAYRVDGILTGGSGGTWQYYCGKAQLELHTKAWVR